MQNRFYLTLISAFFCAPAFAQNVFLDFSNLLFHEIIPLQTDSMYIVSGTQVREIGMEYDAFHRPSRSRDKTTDAAQNYQSYRQQENIYFPNKLISTTVAVTQGPFPSNFIDRVTLDSMDGRVISLYFEVMNNGVWNGVQKDSLFYDAAGHLTLRESQRWDFIEMAWVYEYYQIYEYDSQGNLLVRREINSDSTLINEYISTYDAAGHETSNLWKNGNSISLQNIALQINVYEGNGKLDSLKFYDWVNTNQSWSLSYVEVLDDSPEQQTTKKGRKYRLNNQLEWYLFGETSYIPGPHIYTDQPLEELIKVFKASTNQLENYERNTTTYAELPDGTIKGDFLYESFVNNSWQAQRHVEAWQRKIGTVGTQSPEVQTAPSCGMPNPLAFDALSDYTPLLMGSASTPRMEVFSMDGRLISSQDPTVKAGSSPITYPNLWYLVVIRDEKNIICVQKMYLN